MTNILALPLACSVCGNHCKREPGSLSLGYGYTADKARVCYSCCADSDRAEMLETGRHGCLYLTPAGNGWKVGNWPGSLQFQCYYAKHSWHNFAGKNGRTDAWFNGPDGHVWHAVRIGDMDICRVRRTKTLWKKAA
jgi:hypothetical protein